MVESLFDPESVAYVYDPLPPRRRSHGYSKDEEDQKRRDLHTIRLMDLLPGQDNDEIQITLREVALDDRPKYSALSYCWGSSSSPRTVRCGSKILSIGENLFRFLWHHRNTDSPRTLWVDAISINQKDSYERELQVSIMSSIYSTSSSLLVWLGESDEDTAAVMASIKTIASSIRKDDEDGDLNPDKETTPGLEALYSKLWSEDVQMSLAAFLQRPWFHRIWIVQETMFGKNADSKILCGRDEVYWDEFQSVLMGYLYHSQLPRGDGLTEGIAHVSRLLNGLYFMSSHMREETTLVKTLARYRLFEATDPRDKIYALLGISSDVTSQATASSKSGLQIRVDYFSTPTEVYKILAATVLESQGPYFLNLVFDVDRDSSLPTWVPDWRSSDYHFAHSDLQFTEATGAESLSKFYASGNSVSKLSISDDGTVLSIEGLVLDEIKDSFDVAEDWEGTHKDDIKESLTRLSTKHWEEALDVHTEVPYPTGESRFEAYWQTFCGGHVLLPRETVRAYFVARDYGWSMPRNLTPGERLLMHATFSTFMVRRIAVTKGGFFVLGPRSMEPGDSCVVFKGSRTPFVIRRKGDSWVLVGECYVHGWMHGEAFKEELCETIRLV